MVTALKKDQASKLSDSKKSAYYRREPKQFPLMPPFPCGLKKAIALLDRWVKDQVITLSEASIFPLLKITKTRSTALIIEEKAILLSSALLLGGFSRKSMEHERSLSRMMDIQHQRVAIS